MKVTLTHDGKSVELDLTAEQMTALGLKEEKKKTGYERVGLHHDYWLVCDDGFVRGDYEDIGLGSTTNRNRYQCGNYYSDEDLACANARADRLMRELRRFAAENGGIPSVEDWESSRIVKHTFMYDYPNRKLKPDQNWDWRVCGLVCFLSAEARDKAIEKFHDELIWYFTEYEAMLR